MKKWNSPSVPSLAYSPESLASDCCSTKIEQQNDPIALEVTTASVTILTILAVLAFFAVPR